MKPVKAWAIVFNDGGIRRHFISREPMLFVSLAEALRHARNQHLDKFVYRVVRVEIREIKQKRKSKVNLLRRQRQR